MSDIDFARSMMLWLQARFHLAKRDSEAGQSTLEYVILAAFLAVVAVGVATYIVLQINNAKSRIVTR
jgi:Flp pilus assembly pilin Flp